MFDRFMNPPWKMKTQPLWFWNESIEREGIIQQMTDAKESGYYGLGILPCEMYTAMKPAFMSPEFLELYGVAMDQAEKLDMEMLLYDENWFPSGSGGQQMNNLFPDSLMKVLIKTEQDVMGQSLNAAIDVPVDHRLIGAVAMDNNSGECIDITNFVTDGSLNWNAPSANWKAMLFTIRKTAITYRSWQTVNYLDENAVKDYISLTYQKYYDNFSGYFGKTIKTAFFDEPGLLYFSPGMGKNMGETEDLEGPTAWTIDFNEKFERKYGFNPMPLYPALFYDIGDDTEKIRHQLFSFRTELYCNGWFKTVADWCHDHDIQLTGHLLCDGAAYFAVGDGDPFLEAKHLDIPMIDEVYYNLTDETSPFGIVDLGCHRRGYKLWSSVAYNYDKPLVGTEVFGASVQLTPPDLYRLSMEQYSNGINYTIPHAVWYENNINKIFPKALQKDDDVFGPEMSAYNDFMGRLNVFLQGGRHVADIGILFPQDTHFSTARFGQRDALPSDSNYQDIGLYLSDEKRIDYTYIHAQILNEKIAVIDNRLHLENAINFESYKVFIIPKMEVIDLNNVKKIQQFYNNGGIVIGIGDLPEHAVSPEANKNVYDMIYSIFNKDTGIAPRTNANGGKSYHIELDDFEQLSDVLDDACLYYDVNYECNVIMADRFFRYIHKVKEDKNIYFFINSSRNDKDIIDISIQLEGKLINLKKCNPVNGLVTDADFDYIYSGTVCLTRIPLILHPNQCVFYVSD